LRLFLADNNILFRAGLTRLLDGQEDFKVIGEAETGLDAVRLVGLLHPDIVLIDVNLKNCDALTATRLMIERQPALHVVFLTFQEDDVEMFDCVRTGASGYLSKSVTPVELFTALHGVARGEAAISPRTAAALLRKVAELSAGHVAEPDQDLLTPREREVLALVARGLTNKEIGAALDMSEYTARNHLRHILDKLNLHNRTQAAAYAVRTGLVSIDDLADPSR
jgi:two-component system nitrate/nitrite response regulator NarL